MVQTAIYAGIGTLFLMVLTLRVQRERLARRVEIGDNGDAALLRCIRVHANYLEYTPMMLILMGAAEALGSRPVHLHLAGLCFFLGRLLHAYGFSRGLRTLRVRQAGMVLTMVAMTALAAYVLVLAATLRFSAP